ncbi:ERCC4 domain-containing protein [Shivajiella indica]|uniref:ERCC4 domain-containing protein n=1 Tax=Shivajiella indica TaxID=872115 RepID=A0ABW5BDT2_9BACT
MSRILKTSLFYPLEVIIDDREPISIEKKLLEKGNLLVQRKRLEVGDYMFDNELIVERKTILDFCASIKDGRLFKQIGKLANCTIPGILILEGKQKDFKATDFSAPAINGILISISVGFKIPILRSKGIEETVSIMLQGYKQLTKESFQYYRSHPRRRKFKKKKDRHFHDKIHILEGFPGIGNERARSLLEKFQTLGRVFQSRREEFLDIKGIGPNTWSQFQEILKK